MIQILNKKTKELGGENTSVLTALATQATISIDTVRLLLSAAP
ncbi:hypothetical protein [Pajaroellobacter abortibovis]|nr:hypothetical protein [Pajaroellobacter abortibovis]